MEFKYHSKKLISFHFNKKPQCLHWGFFKDQNLTNYAKPFSFKTCNIVEPSSAGLRV